MTGAAPLDSAHCSPAHALARLASILAPPPSRSQLGLVTLRDHQASAVTRLDEMLASRGIALLADEAGLGKTFTALACSPECDRVIVACPASLASMWTASAERAGRRVTIVSHERLSRGLPRRAAAARGVPTLLIVDEAHGFRNHATRRWSSLASLGRDARVLLLSATPIHNRLRELQAQLALGLGQAAFSMTVEQLGALIVRRSSSRGGGAALPALHVEPAVCIASDERCLQELLALPPALSARDAGDAPTLVLWGLVRRWASSRAALVASLTARLRTGLALTQALEDGRWPSRQELRAWAGDDDAIQLGFTSLLVPDLIDSAHSAPDFAARVSAHCTAIRALLQSLRSPPDPDDARAAALQRIRSRHGEERVLVFTEHADTARAMYRRLERFGGVGLLTGELSRVSGGMMSRAELLRRFAPRAHGASEPRPSERISCLVATDLLSEGVNLQDASVVVHLDLPWSPMRLEQRIGRVRRLESEHHAVTSWSFAAPAEAQQLLAVEERLRAKSVTAGRALGIAGGVLPALFPDAARASEHSPSAARERLAEWLEPFRHGSEGEHAHAGPCVAALSGEIEGAAALLTQGGHGELVVRQGMSSWHRNDWDLAWRLLQGARATAGNAGTARMASALASLQQWLSSERASIDGRDDLTLARTRRRALDRVERATHASPRHRRHEVAALSTRLRLALQSATSAGIEAAVEELSLREDDDARFLLALDALLAGLPRRRSESPWLVQVLLVVEPSP